MAIFAGELTDNMSPTGLQRCCSEGVHSPLQSTTLSEPVPTSSKYCQGHFVDTIFQGAVGEGRFGSPDYARTK